MLELNIRRVVINLITKGSPAVQTYDFITKTSQLRILILSDKENKAIKSLDHLFQLFHFIRRKPWLKVK